MVTINREYDGEGALRAKSAARVVGGGMVIGVVAVLGLFGAFNLIENVSADEIVVVQGVGGKLTVYTAPGPICQCLGRVTSYPKRAIYKDEQVVRFNDGGHGTMKEMSIQYELPLDATHMIELHTKFGSREAIETQLVAKVVNKAVYMTGPLMSSKESYAEKRNYLISYVEDQIAHGVYKTTQQEVRQPDPLTGVEKTSLVVTIVQRNGTPDRQEESSLERYAIRTSNFAFKTLDYDQRVEAQIQQQQQITMDVQTAIANARKAEQDKLTTEQRGAANAAAAKWEQEVLKAKAVTAAQQEQAVAEIRVKAAEAYKQEQTLRGEADAAYRRKVLEADGALSAKLATYERVNTTWAAAFQHYGGQLVPGVVMGGGGGQNAMSSAQSVMDMVAVKMATDLGLSMRPVPAHEVK